MNKFESHWAIARETKDCAVYDRAVKAMLDSASNGKELGAAMNLSINGKTPAVIQAIDLVVGVKQED